MQVLCYALRQRTSSSASTGVQRSVMLPDAERNVKAFEATKITHCCHSQFAKILKSLYSQAKADIKLTGIHNSDTIEIDFNTGVRILTRYMSPNPSLLLMAVKKHLQQYEAANAIAKNRLIRGQNIGVSRTHS